MFRQAEYLQQTVQANTKFPDYISQGKAWKATALVLSLVALHTKLAIDATNWWRSDKYDLNHANALPLMRT